MAIPSRAVPCRELHCLTHDGLVVITAQHWSDPEATDERPRSWLRLVRNGVVRQDRSFTGPRAHRELEQFWSRLEAQYRAARLDADDSPAWLDEDQMWVQLRELTGIEQTTCQRDHCYSRMPVAWWICAICGANARRVASGSLTGVRRYVVVVSFDRGGSTETR